MAPKTLPRLQKSTLTRQFSNRNKLWESDLRKIHFYPSDPLPAGELFVIGTIHRVPELKAYLERLLFQISPRLISVEISPYSLKLRKKRKDLWRRRLEELSKSLTLEKSPVLEGLERIIEFPYEVSAAFKVAQRLKIKVLPLDISSIARKHLAQFESLLTPEGIKEILRAPPPSLEKEFAFARLTLKNNLSPPVSPEDLFREEVMAQRLKRLVKRYKPLVHVGGWGHLQGLGQRLPEARLIFLDAPSALFKSRDPQKYQECLLSS